MGPTRLTWGGALRPSVVALAVVMVFGGIALGATDPEDAAPILWTF